MINVGNDTGIFIVKGNMAPKQVITNQGLQKPKSYEIAIAEGLAEIP
jgi:hypothetical protein